MSDVNQLWGKWSSRCRRRHWWCRQRLHRWRRTVLKEKDARRNYANEIWKNKIHWRRGEDLEKQRGIMQMRLSNTWYIGKHRLLFLIKDTPVKIVASKKEDSTICFKRKNGGSVRSELLTNAEQPTNTKRANDECDRRSDKSPWSRIPNINKCIREILF